MVPAGVGTEGTMAFGGTMGTIPSPRPPSYLKFSSVTTSYAISFQSVIFINSSMWRQQLVGY